MFWPCILYKAASENWLSKTNSALYPITLFICSFIAFAVLTKLVAENGSDFALIASTTDCVVAVFFSTNNRLSSSLVIALFSNGIKTSPFELINPKEVYGVCPIASFNIVVTIIFWLESSPSFIK